MLDVNITYHADTRLMEITSVSTGDTSGAVATTGDDLMTELVIIIEDLEGELDGYTARLEYGVNVTDSESHAYRPFVVLGEIHSGSENIFSTRLPQSILSSVKCSLLPIQLAFTYIDENLEKTELYSLNTVSLVIKKALDAVTDAEFDRNPKYGDAIYNVTYDSSTATIYFTQMDGSELQVEISGVLEKHYVVSTRSELVTLSEAVDGDTATVQETGLWYVLYGPYDVLSSWNEITGGAVQNGTQVSRPTFYAPEQSGDSGQYLESRGEYNSPEWVSKVTDINYGGDAVPTATAVKEYTDAETTRATGVEDTLYSADAQIQSSLDSEISTRTTQFNNLQNGKRDKISSSHSYPVAYTQDTNGQESQTNIVSDLAVGDSIVSRTSGGTIVSSTPQNDSDVAIKSYVDGEVDSVNLALTQHKEANNPHNITKTVVGLSDVENHPMDSQPTENSENYVTSGGVATAIANESAERIEAEGVLRRDIDAHINTRTGNPHDVTKSDVHLGDVENYPMDSQPQANSPNYVTSAGVYSAIDDNRVLLEGEIGDVEEALVEHEQAVNPHNITKVTVGLGNVENEPMDTTPDANSTHYISSGAVYTVNHDLTEHIGDTGNPHHVTKSDVELGNVDNTSDLDKPISNATQLALDDKVDKISIDPSGSGFVKIDVNSQGQVTGHSAMSESDIPQLSISKITNLQSTLDGKATENHASASTTYGVGDATNYGHVKMDTTIGDSDRTDTTISESGIRAFVNSSISTNTANYISDNGNPFTNVNDLPTTSPPVTNNDYAVVVITDAQGNKAYDRYKATVNGNGNVTWALEYEINSSEFTAQQWATINSGMSSSDKTKLDGIQTGAEVNVQSDWNVTDSTSDAYIKNKPTIPTIPSIQISGTNIGTVEAGKYIASLSANGHTISAVKASLPTLATVATSGSYNDLLDKPTIPTIPNISVATSGSGNALTGVSVDSSNKHKLNFTTGTFLTAHQDISGKMNTDMSNIAVAGTKADGKTVVWDATNTRWMYGEAGKVDDVKVNNVSVVTNKVANITVPTVNNNKIDFKDKNGTIAQTFYANQSSDVILSFEGSGGTTVTADATNKKFVISTGTIPTVNNGTLTIKLNGTSVGTFTANQAGNTTVELTDHTYTVNNGTLTIKSKAKSEAESTTASEVTLGTFSANSSSSPTIKIPIPTKVSDLENDTGFITGLSFSQLSSHPNTLAGYGITDAKIANGVITLGSNTITPITDVSGKADKSTTVTNVFYDNTSSSSTYRYLRKTINGTTSNIVQLAKVATSGAYSDLSGQPTKLSQFTNDSGYITTWTTVNNGTLTIQGKGTSVATFTANQSGNTTLNIAEGTGITITNDTSATTKKITIASNIQGNVQSDWNATSGLAVILNKPTLATVATTGAYSDLTGKPTIPTVYNKTFTVQGAGSTATSFTANSNSDVTLNITGEGSTSVAVDTSATVKKITISTPTLATVATSGSYNDLSNRPTIPTVNNGTFNIKSDGVTVQSFTANASGTYDMTFVSGTKIFLTRNLTHKKLTVDHENTTRTDTTSTASPAHGGTFTAVDSVSTDATGHITAVNVKTVTLPTDQNTDTKVSQKIWTGNHNLPLLMSYETTSNTTDTITNISYRNNGIFANPSTGKITSTLISATQVGGMTKTYELQATGYKIALQLDKDTFWTTNSGQAYAHVIIEYSRVPFGTLATLDVRKGIWEVFAKFSGNDYSVIAIPNGDSVGTGDGTLRYFRIYAPKNASYGPQIGFALENANIKVYIRVTLLTGTPGWNVLSTLGSDPGTTNYNVWTPELGRYNQWFTNLKLSANITGSCDGTSGSAWDALRNDRYVFGESAVGGSIMAMATDGRMYKLRNGANKVFRLPLHCGRCTGTFTYDGSVSPPTLTNYAQIMWNMRSQAYSELTNATMQGTAFTVPTLTAGQYGLPLYVTGTLSGSGFVPDGNIVTAMVNGKTNIQIGRIDRSNTALNAVPTLFTITGYGQNAYTLDSNGKLTHIDGKQVYDSGNSGGTVTSVKVGSTSYNPSSGVVSLPAYPTVNNGILTIKDGLGNSLGTFKANQSGNSTITLPNGTLQMQNVLVTFSANTTYPSYPYRASINVTGATANSFADVVFSEAQIKSGLFAPFCVTGTNVVYIYARSDPGAQTIPTVSVGFDNSALTVDATPTSGSTNAVTSGGVYDALNPVQATVSSSYGTITKTTIGKLTILHLYNMNLSSSSNIVLATGLPHARVEADFAITDNNGTYVGCAWVSTDGRLVASTHHSGTYFGTISYMST